MNEYNKDIGNRIKELRELSDIAVQDIAQKLNIDAETYTQYETGEVDIPASFLYEIANIFQVDFSLLLTGEESRMSIFDITRAGKGVSIDRRKEYKYENLCSKFIHKKAETFYVTVDPKENTIPSLNSHHNNEIILNEGDSIFFDSNHRHAMVALNDKPARFIAILM